MVNNINDILDYSKFSQTELLKLINDNTSKHNKLKEDIIKLSYQIDELNKQINEIGNIMNDKIENLKFIENKYILLIEEYSNR